MNMRFRRRQTAKVWADQHSRAFTDLDSGRIDAENWWKLRVEAQHGLINEGLEALPFALEMLNDESPDIREDGAAILGAVGKDDAIVDALISSLAVESDDQPRDVIVGALGRLKSKRAIPSLAALIRDPNTDGDTRSEAIEALGSIVRRRFDRQSNPAATALAWLDQHAAEREMP